MKVTEAVPEGGTKMVIFNNTWLVSEVESKQMNLYYALGKERRIITVLAKLGEGRAIRMEIAI